MSFSYLAIRFVVLLSLTISTTAVVGDEVVIDRKAPSKVSVGDFDCSKCPNPAKNIFSLIKDSDGDLTAGQLWQFFDSQGVSSVEHLVLCLDVQATDGSTEFGINSVDLTIEDPAQLGMLLTNVSLGDNSLVFPNHDISSFKPEAKLEFALGYDFMERFSADSTAKISLDVSSRESSAQPVVSVQGGGSFFGQKFNFYLLVVFAVFWSAVFLMLNRFTKPQVKPLEQDAKPATGRQALSA